MIKIPKDKYPTLWSMDQTNSIQLRQSIANLVKLGETVEGAMHQLEFDFSRI